MKRGSRWRVPAATTALLVSAIACGGADAPTTAVTGVVIDISARSLTDIESLTVRDESGATWVFGAEGYGGVAPSHLRQHMVLGMPVTVSFRRRGDALVIESIVDYTPGETPEPHR